MVGARLARLLAQPGEVDRAALRMQVEHTLGQLGHLGEAARHRDALDRVPAQVFQHAADEVAHVDDGRVRKVVERLDGLLGCVSRGTRHVVEAERPRHVDAAVDRVDPGRAGVGHHDARGPEDRQAAHDAEPAVQRPLGQLLAARDRDLHLGIRREAEPGRGFADGGPDHAARHGIDGGLARRKRQPGTRDPAHALTGPKQEARARGRWPNRRDHERAVRDIGVIPGVLDDAGAREALPPGRRGQCKGRPTAPWEQDLDRIGEASRVQSLEGGPRRRRGAGAGRPAATKQRGRGRLSHAVKMDRPDRAIQGGRPGHDGRVRLVPTAWVIGTSLVIAVEAERS